MDKTDNVLAAIEAGEGLTPIHVESTDISSDLTHQSQPRTSGIRLEIFQAIEQPCKSNLPSIKAGNTDASDGENHPTNSSKQNPK